MRKFLKSIYRSIQVCFLRRKKVFVSFSTLFNPQTKWGGYNKIGVQTVVSDSMIGRYTFMGSNCYFPNAVIGKFCSIGHNVRVVAETHPARNFISTSPVFYSLNRQCGTTFVNKQLFNERLSVEGHSCIVGNDVWIGDDVRIIGGITIGDGAIIGLGAVVTKDIPPYAIVGGIPAKIIRYRFEQDKIDDLLREQWWNKEERWIIDNLVLQN